MMNLRKLSRPAFFLLAAVLWAASPLHSFAQPARQAPTSQIYLPVLRQAAAAVEPTPLPPTPQPEDWLGIVNHYRGLAGSPPVSQDERLNANCWQHARYMAENNHLTHNQNPDLPFASPEGQVCAGSGNAWLGSTFPVPYWKPAHTFNSWMGSIGHRLWLLYPTTPTFGYGFYTASNNQAGAALDVLSTADFSKDRAYPGWPVRYPAPNQTGVPASAYPITLNWSYFGPAPTLQSTRLETESGAPVPHSASTELPVGHKGIKIQPDRELPAGETLVVTVNGTYDGSPFTYTWKFSTAGGQ